jgi:hypothetical protein
LTTDIFTYLAGDNAAKAMNDGQINSTINWKFVQEPCESCWTGEVSPCIAMLLITSADRLSMLPCSLEEHLMERQILVKDVSVHHCIDLRDAANEYPSADSNGVLRSGRKKGAERKTTKEELKEVCQKV